MLAGVRDRFCDSFCKRVSFGETWPPLSQPLLDGGWHRCRPRFAEKKSIGFFGRPISRRRWADGIMRWFCA
jgi:hypothetical protein